MGMNETLKAISDPVRRDILSMLKDGRKSAGEIAEHFHITGATVSYHLSKLKSADLISEQKHKKIYVYSSEIEKAIIGYIIIDKIIEGTIDYILENTNNENNKEIIKYYDGCEKGYALKIGKTIKFDKPIFLKEIKNNDKNFIVPQFYRYIKENEYIYKVLNKK